MLNGKNIMVTGGTGSFGNQLTRYVLENFEPRRLIIFSRDEFKQFEMQGRFPEKQYPCMRYFLGDVRDIGRLKEALHGVDYVIHAAALKQVPAAEYNPFEFIRTNIDGAENVVRAAIANNVKKVVALSTDKAANPINLYGATKLVSDKIFVAANNMYGGAGTIFSVVRYGNVVGSRGSVVPFFAKKLAEGAATLPITDERMTRFWITLEQGVAFTLSCLGRMSGGEIFLPKIPSMSIMNIVEAMSPGHPTEIVGIRPGEKLHEMMVPADESINTVEYDDRYVITPAWWDESLREGYRSKTGGRFAPVGFEYRSDNNTEWLKPEKLADMLRVMDHD
jgi:UDP-N-acetylglucosamine 4,6-dehydratase